MVQLVCTILSICYMIHIVLTRLSIRALLLVEELVHTVLPSPGCARLVAEQCLGREVDGPNLVLQVGETLLGGPVRGPIKTRQAFLLLLDRVLVERHA